MQAAEKAQVASDASVQATETAQRSANSAAAAADSANAAHNSEEVAVAAAAEAKKRVKEGTQLGTPADNTVTTEKIVDRAVTADKLARDLTLPPGAVCWFARSTPPEGYLVCNGNTVSRRTYKLLFEAIGTIYGKGDGKTTFNLPDCRGEFIRGWDNGRGVDADRVFGSAQSHAIQSYTHTAMSEEAGAHNHGGATSINGEHTHTLDANFSGGGESSNTHLSSYRGRNAQALPNGNHQHTIHADGAHQHAIQIQETGGHETRPSNIAMLICIKY